jgi:hypothetical protein
MRRIALSDFDLLGVGAPTAASARLRADVAVARIASLGCGERVTSMLSILP